MWILMSACLTSTLSRTNLVKPPARCSDGGSCAAASHAEKSVSKLVLSTYLVTRYLTVTLLQQVAVA